MIDKITGFYRKYTDLANCFIIVIAVAVCFLPSLNYETFIMDDLAYVGPSWLFSLSWSNIKTLLTSKTVGLNSPLVMLSFIPDRLIWGSEYFHTGCRFQNILWHSAAMALFYLTLRELCVTLKNSVKISFPPTAALFAALAAAIHPQRVESVVWIAERKDVMVLTLGMAAIYCFIKAYKKNKSSVAVPILLFISLAAVKPLMLSLPIILTIGYLAVKRPFDFKDMVRKLSGSYLAAALYIMLNWKLYASFTSDAASHVVNSAGENRIFIAFHNIWLYFAKTLFPVKLNPCYPFYRPGEVSFWAMALLLTAALAAVIFSLVRNPWKEFFARAVLPAGLMFGAAVLPVCNLRRIGNVDFADRYSYFPSLFIWMAAAAVLVMLYRKYADFRRFITLVPAIYLASLLLVTAAYMPAWKDKTSQLDAMLDTPRPHIGALKLAAFSAFTRNNFDETENYIMLIQAEKSSNPADVYFVEGMQGLLQIRLGNEDAGIARINAFLSRPDWFRIIGSSKDFIRVCILSSAAWHLKQKNDPRHKIYAANLFDMAAQAFSNWNNLESLNFRAIAMMIRGDYRQAEALFTEALKLVPDDENIRRNLHTVRQKISGTAPAATIEKNVK